MPTLRFTRDKRGYENTYVVHNPRRRHRGRPRILYWFRTPPGVRVGRAALDEDAIRLIEEHHPQIRFDWAQILNGEEEAAPPEAPASLSSVAPSSVLPPEEPVNPAHARLGSEGLARLRARYADVAATIARRVQDEQQRQQLHEQATRLDPDSWVTEDEVRRGLEEYEGVLASLRDVVGRRRRRRRSGAGPAPSPEKPAEQSRPDEDDREPEDGVEPDEP